MITHIVKRDGRVEAFAPSKLNNWAEWATSSIGSRVDWSSIVLEAVRSFEGTVKSQDLQHRLITLCTLRRDWAHNLMAGRLYAATMHKELYDEYIPTVRALFQKMHKAGLMRKLKYSNQDYAAVEAFIQHDRDFELAHFQLEQLRRKYAIQNRNTGVEYETPQFTFMRMAMALAEDEPKSKRLSHIKEWYDHFSLGRINAPTPNYVNLGTEHNGYASCCLYTVEDTARSLAIGDHIAYTMTYMSAGIGGFINSRSIGDSVRSGAIIHQGKLPYFKSLGSAVKANLQGGRGGACTSYYSVFDPEASVIMNLQNPRSTEDRKNRDIHFAMLANRLFAKKVAKNQDIFTFNVSTAPDLVKLFFSGDQDGFELLYNQYEADTKFVKNYVNARKLVIQATQQSYETGTHYFMFVDEANRHTSFLDPIYSGNLCLEVVQPTKAYSYMPDLYLEEDHGRGEVSLCSIAAIVEPNIKSDSEYESACYYALKMIDKCIHLSDYELPHVGFTAKQRLNAGVGLIGTATTMARKKLKYNSKEGLDETHRIAERHAYFTIKASLQLGKEYGNAPWIHKTKWPSGWLPIDSYKQSVDSLSNLPYTYDWEQLRKDIVANGGIRNSSCVSHMPTESSSKASGVPNAMYPIRDLAKKKTDASNTVNWCATDSDLIGEYYQLAWDIPSIDMIKVYAVIQKFTDQTISADLYKDRSVKVDLSSEDMVNEFLAMVKYGMKTRYYQNSLTSDQSGKRKETDQITNCGSGGCSL
jgi:ribonucleoside-diphosphate reductase alpha chain